MISYKPFENTLKETGITKYQLIYRYGFHANTLHRMKHGEAITTSTLDELCRVLGCGVSGIIAYEED